MMIGISGFGFFVQELPIRDAHLFSKHALLRPLFLLCFLGARVFGPSC